MGAENTDAKFIHNAKRKWQIALRRYILEGAPAIQYAQYFGIDHQNLRKWIELQFTGGLSWENYATEWQFDHIVPQAYFDFANEEDLKLCWHFINIRVEPIIHNKYRSSRIDVIGVKKYFEDLFQKTGYSYCTKMLQKIESIEISNIESNHQLESFVSNNKKWLEEIQTLSAEEFAKFNSGISLEDVLLERVLFKKYGS
jgi:hypothetical protein